MIDWNDNAKAAVDYFADWLRADYNYIANLEDFYRRLPQTKTVADAVEQEGEKWTHTYHALKCRVLIDKPDGDGYIIIVNERNEYYCALEDDIKPIKPTISKAEAWDKLLQTDERVRKLDDAIFAIADKYDII